MDVLLTACLLLLVPAYALRRSLSERASPLSAAKVTRYLRAMMLASALTLLLAITWGMKGRSLGRLGLAMPLAGWLGLALAVLLLAGGFTFMQINASKLASRRDDLSADMLPATTLELRLFVLMSIILGFSWELLYRGYLIFILQSCIGITGAIVVAATAYGVAHGYKSWKLFVGSLISALIFTLAYVATRSLWWLMLIHAALPLLAVLQARSGAGAATGITPTASA